MLKSKGLPYKFWAEAVTTAIYLINLSPTKAVLNKTPYEAWSGKKPSVEHLKIFGCIVYVLINAHERHKLEENQLSAFSLVIAHKLRLIRSIIQQLVK